MVEEVSQIVFPAMAKLRLKLQGEVRREFETLIRDKGWTPEEGVKIMLGYLAAARSRQLSPVEARDELGAARGELAVLRHRAFMADDAIQTLKMNVTGFEKSLEQFAKTLPRLEREERELHARLDRLLAEAARRGIEVEPEEPEAIPTRRSFIDFYRQNAKS